MILKFINIVITKTKKIYWNILHMILPNNVEIKHKFYLYQIDAIKI